MAKPRVLVVENDLEWRIEHCDKAEELGYEAVVAEGQGDSLIQDALIKNRIHRCHAAIVDMRLRSNQFSDDLSGIDEVALKLDPASVIVVSAFLDLDIVNRKSELADARGVSLSYASKSGDANVLIEMLRKTLYEASSYARGLEINDDRKLLDHFELGVAEEICDVMGRLFPEGVFAGKKSILKLEPALRVVAVVPQNHLNQKLIQLLLWVTPHGGKAYLVKVAPIERIRTEMECSEILFDRRRLSRNLTRINSFWFAWRLGGIAYDVGRQRSLVEFYQSEGIDDENIVLQGLEWFFKDTLPRFRRLPVHGDFDELLVNRYLGINQQFPVCPKFDGEQIDKILSGLPDPSVWIQENLSDVLDDKLDRSYGEIRLERILVDTDKWMTFLTGDDLGNPIGLLKSCVALEIDLLINAIPENEAGKLSLFLNLAISVAEPNRIIQSDQDLLPTKDVQNNPSTRRAIRAISHLRRLAFSNISSGVTQDDYLVRLLLECGNRLLREVEPLSSDQVWQLHLFASVLVARIDLIAIRGLAWLKSPLPFSIKLCSQSDITKWLDEVKQLQNEMDFLKREDQEITNPKTQQLRDKLIQYGVLA